MQLQQCRPEQTRSQAEPVVVDMERGRKLYMLSSLYRFGNLLDAVTPRVRINLSFLVESGAITLDLKLKNE